MNPDRSWILNMDCHAKRRQVLGEFSFGPEVTVDWPTAQKYEGFCGEYREFDGSMLAVWQTGAGIALLTGSHRLVLTEPTAVAVKAKGNVVRTTLTSPDGERIEFEEPLPPNARDNPTFDYLDEISSIFGCCLQEILESKRRIQRYGSGPPNN